MPRGESRRVSALLLRSRDFGESDRVITFLSREEGLLPAVARGVSKPRSRLAGALQLFALLDVELASGRNMDTVTGARVCEAFYPLRTNLDAFSHACYLSELVAESVAEHQPLPNLFDMLVGALGRLAAGDDPWLLARYVEISLSALLGYLPALSRCAACSAALAPPDAAGHPRWPVWLGFSSRAGGALCPACLPGVPGGFRLSAGTLQVASLLLTKGLDALRGRPLSLGLRREIEATFRSHLESHLERPLRSAALLHALDTPPDR